MSEEQGVQTPALARRRQRALAEPSWYVPPPDIAAPDGKPFGVGKYIGITAEGKPIPRLRETPPEAKRNPFDGGPDVFYRSNEYRACRDATMRYRNSQRRASRRPHWWSPNGVIEKLEDGESITQILEQAVADCGRRVKVRILFRDLARWKKLVPGFKEDYKRATHLYQGQTLPESRWEMFFKAMEAFEGKVELACGALGIGAKVIYGMLDPQFKETYNKTFAERYRRAELDRWGPIRASMLNKLERPDADPKVQLAALATAMPALHGTKKTVAVEGGLDLRLHNAAEEQLAQRNRALFPAAPARSLPAAPEPVTIDVVAEAIKEEL